MVGLPDGENTLRICLTVRTIPTCDGQTDRRTDILPRHSSRYAYASRGKNTLRQNCMTFAHSHTHQFILGYFYI